MTAALNANAYLHHLDIGSPQPSALAKFYGDVMNMQVTDIGGGSWLAKGPARRVRFSEGPAKKLLQAGFAVRDKEALATLQARATDEGLDPAPRDEALFQAGAFAVTDPDKNRIVFGLSHQDAVPERHFIRGPLQHLTFATKDVGAIEDFYVGKLGFALVDRVVNDAGVTTTSFMRSNHEHHTVACFLQDREGIDHHSYEAGEWDTIRDWCDHFAARDVRLMWGPGRHGPGNNLFIFIVDPDGNWIEVSAELEVIHDRPVKTWPHAEHTLNLWGDAILRS